jgi:hypothetical protein
MTLGRQRGKMRDPEIAHSLSAFRARKQPLYRYYLRSKMEAVAHLHVYFPRVHVMCSAEGIAVIQQVAPVGNVQ